MTETLFKFLLGEIKTIRIICGRIFNGEPCCGIVEVPLNKLSKVNKCPVCEEQFLKPGEMVFANLKLAIQNALDLQEHGVSKARIEFVLPDPQATKNAQNA